MIKNIVCAGTAGDGVYYFSKVLGEILYDNNKKIIITPLIGLGVTGGSIVTNIRISNDYYISPQVPNEKADLLICWNLLELYRNRKYINDETIIILYEKFRNPILNKKLLSNVNINSINNLISNYNENIIRITKDEVKYLKSFQVNGLIMVKLLHYMSITISKDKMSVITKSFSVDNKILQKLIGKD